MATAPQPPLSFFQVPEEEKELEEGSSKEADKETVEEEVLQAGGTRHCMKAESISMEPRHAVLSVRACGALLCGACVRCWVLCGAVQCGAVPCRA